LLPLLSHNKSKIYKGEKFKRNMKTLGKLLFLGAIGLASILPMKSMAEANVSLDSIFSSRYMFYGLPFSKGNINQTMLNVSNNENNNKKNNFTGTLWDNYDAKQNRLNEVDIFMDYTRQINNKLNLSLGAIYFRAIVEDKWKECTDWYAGIHTNFLLNPSLTYNKYTGFGKGNYTELGISKDFPGNNRFTVSTSGKLGYNNRAFRDKRGFSHLEGNLKFPITLSKKLSIIPNINYSRALAKDLKNTTWGGINLHYDF